MPRFTPRLPLPVLRDLLSKVVNRTDLNDINVGSSLFTLMNAIAHEISNTEGRMFNLRQSYALENASGSDLDARVSELPPVGIARKRGTSASGSVLTITRLEADPTTNLIIPAGSTVASSEDGTVYTITQDAVILAGFTEVENVSIVCNATGLVGNAATGVINQIINMPGEISEVTNSSPLVNGIEEESDQSLRDRAIRYLNSMGRTSISALEFLATSFIDTNNTTFPFAAVYEDPTKPGLCELIVDDGTGEYNSKGRGYGVSFRAPEGGANFVSFERPAVKDTFDHEFDFTVVDSNGNEKIDAFGNPFNFEGKYQVIPERGIIFFDDGVLEEGDVFRLAPYDVYKGFIAELQEEIEGNVNRGNILRGWRAAGTRVRVVPPDVQDLIFDIVIRPINPGNVDLNALFDQVRNEAINFVNQLSPGQPFYPAQLVRQLLNTQPIISANILIAGQRDACALLNDRYPSSNRVVFRTNENFITVDIT